MFVLILLFCVSHITAATGLSLEGEKRCKDGGFVTFSLGEIKAEAGLCVVIPCSFKTNSSFTPKYLVFYKCEPSKQKCADSDTIFHSNMKNKVQPGFVERVSLLQPDLSLKNCSIIINDLTESDSGSYQLGVHGLLNEQTDTYKLSSKVTLSVKGLTQKPTVGIPPLTEGQQTTLSCTAPGLCSGSDPEITWTWRGAGEKDSHISATITAVKTEHLTSVTQRRSSTLTFNSSAEHHGTDVTCKVRFTNDITTEETVTLNVTFSPKISNQTAGDCVSNNVTGEAEQTLTDQRGPEIPWMVIAVVSLVVNIICMILLMFLWNTRKKVTPNQEDRTYMSLQKTHQSPEYDVIARPLN